MNLLKVFVGLFVVGLIVFASRNHLMKSKQLCNTRVDEGHFLLREASSDGKRSSFKLCSDNLEGEITLTAETSAEVGNGRSKSLIFGLKSTFMTLFMFTERKATTQIRVRSTPRSQ